MKQIIWSSDALLDETAREYYQNFKREELDDDAYKVSDEEWSDEVYNELGDERQNLNKDVNGVIIAFGDLGLWNGRKQGYQILGDNIAEILQSTQYDAEWYVTATIYEAVCRTMMARIMFCTVSLKIVTTQNGLPQKSTTMKLTRMVFAKLHVPSTPMWPQCMAGKLYRTTSFR